MTALAPADPDVGLPPAGEVRALTGLRGIAAGLVVAFHVGAALPGPTAFELPGRAGYVGVTFFFVLSGFVLTWAHRPGQPTAVFARRRAARILPLHVVTWAAALGVLVLEGAQLSAKPLLANLLLLQAWVPLEAYYYGGNGVAWSISCEAFFYAALPLVLAVGLRLDERRLRAAGALLLAAAVAVPLSVRAALPDAHLTGWLWTFPPVRALEFLLGVVLALAHRRGRLHLPLARVAPVVAAALPAAVALDAVLGAGVGGAERQDVVSLVALPAVVLLIPAVVTAEQRGTVGWLAGPALVRLGRWSFALYLTHQLLLRVVVQALPHPDALGAARGAAVQGGVVLASVAVAAVAHRVVERPLAARLRGRDRCEAPPATVG